MTTPLFYNAKKELTAYGLSCGYIQTHTTHGITVTLWKESQCYHVRTHDHNHGGRIDWQTYDSDLTAARKGYRQQIKNLSKINAESPYYILRVSSQFEPKVLNADLLITTGSKWINWQKPVKTLNPLEMFIHNGVWYLIDSIE
jgi:hypothetical protein